MIKSDSWFAILDVIALFEFLLEARTLSPIVAKLLDVGSRTIRTVIDGATEVLADVFAPAVQRLAFSIETFPRFALQRVFASLVGFFEAFAFTLVVAMLLHFRVLTLWARFGRTAEYLTHWLFFVSERFALTVEAFPWFTFKDVLALPVFSFKAHALAQVVAQFADWRVIVVTVGTGFGDATK